MDFIIILKTSKFCNNTKFGLAMTQKRIKTKYIKISC